MDGLPERSNQPKKERAYRTSLPALEFLKLEKEVRREKVKGGRK